MRFFNISVRPWDHAPFLETHGNSVRLGRSLLVESGRHLLLSLKLTPSDCCRRTPNHNYRGLLIFITNISQIYFNNKLLGRHTQHRSQHYVTITKSLKQFLISQHIIAITFHYAILNYTDIACNVSRIGHCRLSHVTPPTPRCNFSSILV